MQALDSIAPATFGRPLCADAVAASSLAVAAELVGILLSLMSALSLPGDYMVIERGKEVFIEPLSA